MEEFAKRESTGWAAALLGPRLDNLPSDMIDTGKSKSGKLRGQNSFSNSRGSSSELGEWPLNRPSKDSPSKDSKKGSRKLFQFRGSKKKEKQVLGLVP